MNNNINLTEIPEKDKSQDYDLILIRHAQSQFNKGIQAFIQLNKLEDMTKEEIVKNTNINSVVIYNQSFIDPKLTQNGFKQCQKTKQSFNVDQVDLILVSPQKRTLQTCKAIFGNHKNVIVHPLLSEMFKYSCDISNSMENKINEFKSFNFQEMKNWTDQWFLEVLSQQKRQICSEYFSKNNVLNFKAKQQTILELLNKEKFCQNSHQFRERVWKVKQLINDLKSRFKAKKVAVISHQYTIQYLLSPGFNEKGEAQDIEQIQNGKAYFRRLQDLLKVK